jgi:hypothetical protein
MITETDKLECEKFLDEQEKTYREGDIVFWSYSETYFASLKGYSPYHCRSQIAVFNGKRFVDTFWSHDNFSFGPEKIGQDIVVEYVGNFDSLDKRSNRIDYLIQYYDSKDIVNLNHSNNTSGNLYLRKGAKRCLKTMKECLSGKIASAEREIEYKKQSLESDKKALQNLTQETIDSTYF